MKSNRIYFELTEACNLRCKHCFNNGNNYRNLYLPIKDLILFREKAKSAFGTDSVLTGGEPLLYPEIKLLIEKFSKDGKVLITTNGTLLKDEDYIEMLTYSKDVFFQFSFDGAQEESFDKMRGKGVFQKVYRRIVNLCKKGFGEQIGFSMVITKHNIHEVHSLIKMAKILGVSSIHFPTLIHEGNCIKNIDIVPNVEELNSIENELINMMADEEEIYISSNTVNNLVSTINNNFSSCIDNPTLKISPNGNIMACPVMWKSKDRLASIYDLDCVTKVIEKLTTLKQKTIIPEESIYYSKNLPINICEFCNLKNDYDEEAINYRCKNLCFHLNNIKKELGE
ncbi:radical SAM protein [Candidatus Enterococcus ikei]|uniref:Radical SAM protein n=1 Tax=Candidatus Enterococcus ikei TaxID=2815326 RepID=A0ABS3GW12_9ENTE|nr:radical SAM protein [Enterococcus sp. DIV0869a]MBO0439010.1 radical SAM protein [Enterococcus sp. DIV0869a]